MIRNTDQIYTLSHRFAAQNPKGVHSVPRWLFYALQRLRQQVVDIGAFIIRIRFEGIIPWL